jgi:glycine cleavage system H protein
MKFSTSHEWVLLEKNIATIGISKDAEALLGEIVYVELPAVGKEVKKEEAVGLLEASKAALDLYAPLSGKVVECNEKVQKNPSLINKSPQKEGWLYKLQISNNDEYELLMDEKQYRSFV